MAERHTIDYERLLGRPIRDELGADVCEQLHDRCVLVTGAGGSIGSALCRALVACAPSRLILLGHGEHSVYHIQRELAAVSSATDIIPVIADIQDRALMERVLGYYRPEIVLHAAAHKHVPLMEMNPESAVKNNILGTRNAAEAALACGAKRFVLVSTDKAVHPTSLMGATKRLAEMITLGMNGNGETRFSLVRLVNVLGSRGSVLPLFLSEMAAGEPITITDRRMTRYFMTPTEAAALILQAAVFSDCGEAFAPDPGEPVSIIELAHRLAEMIGVQAARIVEIGARPGEKLEEVSLLTEADQPEAIGSHSFRFKLSGPPKEAVLRAVDRALEAPWAVLKSTLIDYANTEGEGHFDA